MLTKEKVLQSLQDLPDTFSMDELIDRIILINKIETGLEQVKSGKTYTAEQAREKLKPWLK